MSIQSDLDELDEINKEIKANNIRNKALRGRIEELNIRIQTYLTNKEQPGLKYKNKAILLENKAKHTRKTKKDKEADTIAYLESIGMSNPKDIYEKIQTLQKGEAYYDQKLMIKDITAKK